MGYERIDGQIYICMLPVNSLRGREGLVRRVGNDSPGITKPNTDTRDMRTPSLAWPDVGVTNAKHLLRVQILAVVAGRASCICAGLVPASTEY